MQRQRWKDHRSYSEVFAVALKFQPGDTVHAIQGGEIGKIEYIRQQDGFACVQWPSGAREWVHQDLLCGPLANPTQRVITCHRGRLDCRRTPSTPLPDPA